jgi:hypothetical protein
LCLTTGEKRRIDLWEDFVERQSNLNLVAIRLQRKNIWSHRAQFSKRNFDGASC